MEENFHYTYIIICLYDGTIYYGVRSSKLPPELDTDYMGSGIELREKIKELGESSFIKIVHETFTTRSHANLFERMIVNKRWVESKFTMNCVLGGLGSKPEHERTHVERRIIEEIKGNEFSLRKGNCVEKWAEKMISDLDKMYQNNSFLGKVYGD